MARSLLSYQYFNQWRFVSELNYTDISIVTNIKIETNGALEHTNSQPCLAVKKSSADRIQVRTQISLRKTESQLDSNLACKFDLHLMYLI